MHNKKWTEDKIYEELMQVIKISGLNRMPSVKEINEYTGNTRLSNAISRNGGFYNTAKKFNLTIKQSETLTGTKYQLYAYKQLKDKGYSAKMMSTKYSYDILLNDVLKIDIKVGNISKVDGYQVNAIGINKRFATCDIYLIYALDDDKKIYKTLIIPAHELQLTTLNMGKKSKYDKFNNRWDIIDKYLNLYEQISI